MTKPFERPSWAYTMAASLEEFQEVLRDETVIDVEKLRDWAVHGIPQEARGEVWKYILQVAEPDQSRDAEHTRVVNKEYGMCDTDSPEFGRLVTFEVARYRPQEALFRDAETQRVFRNVLCAYLNSHDVFQFSSQFVHFCGPIIAALKMKQPKPLVEADVYSLLCRVLALAERAAMVRRLGKFMSLFRTFLPDLYQHFEDEELDPHEWAMRWMQNLLARELRLDCLLPLWDTYFAQDDGFDLHPYVCLAILSKFKEDLEELEHSELHAYLQGLPPMDMNEIIINADNFKQISNGLI
eukprot:m.31422 g.31422  ORF g.31422 m.31422 type:complete len:296 (+) comp9314_c0_seq1:763-1650(+)